MVRFQIDKKTKLARLGLIEQWGDVALDHATPSFMTYCRAGHIPHLTWQVASTQLKLNQKHILQITLPSLINSAEVIAKYGKGLQSFCGIPKGNALHLAIHDPLAEWKYGYNENRAIAIWTKNGRVRLGVKSLRDMVNSFQCASFETLSDYDVDRNTLPKREAKAAERTVAFCEQLLKKDEKIEGSPIITLGGGFSKFYRRKCSVDIGLAPESAGFSVDLHQFLEGEVNLKELDEILEETFSPLPPAKLRHVSGPFDPKMVFHLVNNGFDLFDSSYAVKLAENSEALKLSDSYPNSTSYDLVDFDDDRYADDFTPVFDDCSCYTCTKYTKGYLRHLVNTKELLASILLVIHNMTEYDKMFLRIREYLSNSEN